MQAKKWENESASCSTAVLCDSIATDSSTDDEMSFCRTTSSTEVHKTYKRFVKIGVAVYILHGILKTSKYCLVICSEQNFFVSYLCHNVRDCGNIRRSMQIIFKLRFYRTI